MFTWSNSIFFNDWSLIDNESYWKPFPSFSYHFSMIFPSLSFIVPIQMAIVGASIPICRSFPCWAAHIPWDQATSSPWGRSNSKPWLSNHPRTILLSWILALFPYKSQRDHDFMVPSWFFKATSTSSQTSSKICSPSGAQEGCSLRAAKASQSSESHAWVGRGNEGTRRAQFVEKNIQSLGPLRIMVDIC